MNNETFMTLEEYNRITEEVETQITNERIEFPETVCECGHSVESHCTNVATENAELWGLVVEDEGGEYATFFHGCLKCHTTDAPCEGFWRNA